MTRRSEGFDAFVATYHELRAKGQCSGLNNIRVWRIAAACDEIVVVTITGVKFPTPQMDETRAPIFTPGAPGSSTSATSTSGGASSSATRARPSATKPAAARTSTGTSSSGRAPRGLPAGLSGQLEALQNAVVMLTDIVSAAESKQELASNDIATELVCGLHVCQLSPLRAVSSVEITACVASSVGLHPANQ